ncbi:Tetratricopeptide repeat protein [Azospirillaceae bacterium]
MTVVFETFSRALDHHTHGRLAEAECLYLEALSLQPTLHPALHLLGVAAAQTGRSQRAVEFIRKALALNDSIPDYHSNLGAAYRSLGRLDEAAVSLERALALRPDFCDALNNLGAVLHDLGRYEESMRVFQAALLRHPRHVPALVGLGAALRALGRLDSALGILRRATALDPDCGEAHWGLAATLLVRGDLAAAWPEFDWRWRRHAGLFRRSFPQPRWSGAPLDGRTILLHAEQGRGDTIQFIRYASLLRARGAGRVLALCQPELTDILARVDGVDQVIAYDAPLPPFEVHASLMDLPGVFGTTLETIPGVAPYLSVSPERRARWRRRLEALSGDELKARRWVGLTWAGAAAHQNDRHRSIAPARFEPLLEGWPEVVFFSLQVGARHAEAREAAGFRRVIDPTLEIVDFHDVAAIVDHMDLTIAVDTATAHLVGGLGRPGWVLLPFAPDWRWLLDRADSPWYPSLRLWRQASPGDWDGVIDQMRRSVLFS